MEVAVHSARVCTLRRRPCLLHTLHRWLRLWHTFHRRPILLHTLQQWLCVLYSCLAAVSICAQTLILDIVDAMSCNVFQSHKLRVVEAVSPASR
jgi:hypothetical protein